MSDLKKTYLIHKFFTATKRYGLKTALQKTQSKLNLIAPEKILNTLDTITPPFVKRWLLADITVWPLDAKTIHHQTPLSPQAPLAAIIIPNYNYGQYLQAALDSALNQTLSPLEIVIVDDGSTDPNTHQVLDQIEQAAYPNVTIIRQTNSGLPATRNRGISATKARYICCLDADDLIEPTYLEKTVAALEARPDAGMAYSYARLFGDVNQIWHTEPLDPAKLLHYNHLPVVAVFRRSAWEKVGGYDATMRLGYEDWEFWLRLATEGYRGILIKEPLFLHRRHGETMTHRARQKHRQLVQQITTKHAQVANVKPNPPTQVEPGQAFINLKAKLRPSKQKQLLIIAPWLEVGGAEAVLLQVAQAFVASGRWQVVIMTTQAAANSWRSRFQKVTPLIYDLPLLIPDQYMIEFIASFVARHQTNAVLISHAQLAYTGLARLTQANPNTIYMDLLHNHSDKGFAPTGAQHDDLLSRYIVVHEGIKQALVTEHNIDPAKISVIPNGVDQNLFSSPGDQKQNYKLKNNFNPAKLQIAYLGRLSPEKNPQLFVQAAAELKTYPNVQWLCYGEGELLPQLQKTAASLKAPVEFKGVCHDLATLLKGIDLLVMTSDVEGLPLVAIEALMCGVPVLATAVGGLPQIITPGVNGYLIEKGDLKELCRLLAQLIQNQTQIAKLSANCRPSVQQKYMGQHMANQYLTLIEQTLQNRPSTGQGECQT